MAGDFLTLDIKLQMAHQLRQSGQVGRAESIYKQVIAIDPDNVSAMVALSQINKQPLDFDKFRELLEKAVRRNPDSAQAHIRLGTLLRDNNEFDAARAAYRKAVALEPDNAQLYDDIAIMTQYDEVTEEVRRMQEMYMQTSGNSQKRQKLGFALGKIFDDLKQYDTAFEYFKEANRIGAARANWTNAGLVEWFRDLREIFDRDFLRRYRDIGNPDDCPIFITGMMRTGSTLREQVLCSHSSVYGAGEIRSLHKLINDISVQIAQPFPHGFGDVEPHLLKNVAARYIEDLKSHTSDEAYITDKNNYNFFYAALIAVMLPNARIIYCQRDPRDQGLSYFQKDIVVDQPYCYDLAQIGEITRLSEELMEYWRELMPGKIYVSRYEDLVTRPEESIRALLDHCGLDFEPACLSFHETKREVLNVSRAQIRKPMHSDSVGRWKNYEKHLQPLIDALESD
jgi:tetratricopeptide (TPR) repeat protein